MSQTENQKLISSLFTVKKFIFNQFKKHCFLDPFFFAQHETLRLITEENPTMSALAEKLCITAPTATSIIKTLERKKWVKKVKNKQDARQTQLVVTPEGKNFFLKHEKLLLSTMNEILSPLNQKDKNHLLKIHLKLLNHHLKK